MTHPRAPEAPTAESGAVAAVEIGPLIRALRRRLGLTLSEIGRRAGVSVGFLSQVERGQVALSMAALMRLAEALGVDPGFFLSSAAAPAAVFRAERRQYQIVGAPPLHSAKISADLPGSALHAVLVRVPAGFASDAVRHEGEELIFVLEGAATLHLGEADYALGPGDSVHFRAQTWHRWTNPLPRASRVIWVGTLPMGRRPERDTKRAQGQQG